MALELTLSSDEGLVGVPSVAEFQDWAESALSGEDGLFSLSLRIVGEAEGRELNRRYRGKDVPTNVLSFSAGVPPELAAGLGFLPLGDLALCAPVVLREAREQGKSATDHWAHLTIHGVLHLLGFDHEEAAEAQRMEDRERELLTRFGIADPYALRGGAAENG